MNLHELYNYYNVELADPRTNDWFLVGNPILLGLIIFSYLYFVLKCGPEYMKDRNPYSLKTFIYFYNIFQVIFNSYIVYNILDSGWFTDYSLSCEPVRYNYEPQSLKMTRAIYWTFIIKLIDLVETPIFVLRKKKNQISFLHLYHHVTTLLVAWFSLKYTPGGMMSMLMVVNGSVHMMMYTYYFLASLGPNVQEIIKPFKPYITTVQIVQFLALILHQSQAFLPSCPIPNMVPTMHVTNLLLNLGLFYNFYTQNYKKKSKST